LSVLWNDAGKEGHQTNERVSLSLLPQRLRTQAKPRTGAFRLLILGITLVGSYLVYVLEIHSLKPAVGLAVAFGGIAELIFNYFFAPVQIQPAERGELLKR
jgi:hypothetical protein